MEVLFNRYHRILCDLLVLFLFIGLSIHPFLVQELGFFAVVIRWIARLGLLIYFFKLIFSVFSNIRINKIAWAFLSVLLFTVIISIYSIIMNDIPDYSSPLVVLIFIFIFLIFYTLLLDNRRLFINPLLIVKKGKYVKRILGYITLCLLFSMCLELAIKFVPSNRVFYNYLREEGVIAFAFRLCGFMLDANRWALVLLLLVSIFSCISNKYSFKLTSLLYILYLYLIFTLSKTALFIFLMIMIVDIWHLLLKIRIKQILIFILSFSVVILLLNKTGYEYNGSGLERRMIFTIESVLSPTNSYTVNERKETYKDAFTSILENPFIGVGYLNFTAHTSSSGTLTIHNTFLALLCYFGVILGLILYVFLFILPFVFLAFKYGLSKGLVKLFIISFVFMNLLSVTHNVVLILLFYITLIVFDITARIKIER